MTRSKKHKRRARGSTEEDPNACKRANMAATEDLQDQESTTEEPLITDTEITATETSLEELKEMLVDIQINIANIFRENKSIRNELAELTTTVREQKLEIAHLKTSLTKITKQCADAEYELAAARKRVNEQQDEIYELYDEIYELYKSRNSFRLRNYIRILGLKYGKTESDFLDDLEEKLVEIKSRKYAKRKCNIIITGAHLQNF